MSQDSTDDGILSARHVMEYPYRRSLGAVLGRFFTELRGRRIVGNRTLGGRVLVPPTEYDPETGEAMAEGFVPVGPAGVVTSWAWIAGAVTRSKGSLARAKSTARSGRPRCSTYQSRLITRKRGTPASSAYSSLSRWLESLRVAAVRFPRQLSPWIAAR